MHFIMTSVQVPHPEEEWLGASLQSGVSKHQEVYSAAVLGPWLLQQVSPNILPHLFAVPILAGKLMPLQEDACSFWTRLLLNAAVCVCRLMWSIHYLCSYVVQMVEVILLPIIVLIFLTLLRCSVPYELFYSFISGLLNDAVSSL